MKKISAYANSYNENDKYQESKYSYFHDKSNKAIERNNRENLKCTFATDLINVLQKTEFMKDYISIPPFIYNGLEFGKVDNLANTVRCISDYTFTKDEERCNCRRTYTDNLKRNKNTRFGQYCKAIFKDAFRELKIYKPYFDKKTFQRYKAAFMVYKIIIKVFYFRALPKIISCELYEKCTNDKLVFSEADDKHTEKCQKFAELYQLNSEKNIYIRKRFERRAALIFDDTIAWLIVENELYRFNLAGKDE